MQWSLPQVSGTTPALFISVQKLKDPLDTYIEIENLWEVHITQIRNPALLIRVHTRSGMDRSHKA